MPDLLRTCLAFSSPGHMEGSPVNYPKESENDFDARAAPSSATPQAKTIKRRRLRACDGCRQRKIRCDNNPGSCRNCEVYRVGCFITRDGIIRARSGKARSPAPTLHHSESPRKKLGLNVQYNSQTSPLQAQFPYEELELQQNQHIFQSNEHATASEIPSPSYSTHIHKSPFAGSTSLSNSDMIQGVVVTETGSFPRKSKYTGMSSAQVLAKSAEELFKHQARNVDVMKFFCPLMSFAEEITITPTYSCPLVGKVIADESINILDPIVFLSNYESFYRGDHCGDPSQVASIFLAIALGSSNNEDSAVHSTHFAAAWALYHQFMASTYIGSIQALVLMTLYHMNFHKDGQAVLSIGLAVRIAQSIGLHRSLAAHKDPYEKEFVRMQQNVRNCVWWACYCLDKKLCFEGGRPSAILDDDCDADMPDFNDIDAKSPASTSQPRETSPSSFFRSFIGLCKILSSVTLNLFSRSVPLQSDDSILFRIAAVDEELLTWKNALPSELQPEQELAGIKDGIAYTGAALLHCVYHNAMLVVHRASLLGDKSLQMQSNDNPRIVASDAICLNAARSLARSVNDWISKNPESPITRWTTMYSMNTVFVLYIAIMKSPSRWSSEMDLALMRGMGKCLLQNNKSSKVLANFKNLLDSLCSAVDSIRNAEIGAMDADLENGTGAEERPKMPEPSNSTSFSQAGHVSMLGEKENNFAEDHEYRNDFPDEDAGGSVSMINFHFGNFFGNDPNAFNMQFWPTDFA